MRCCAKFRIRMRLRCGTGYRVPYAGAPVIRSSSMPPYSRRLDTAMKHAQMHAPIQLRVVGSHVAAQDGLAKVTGTALYTFDRSLPGMLHAKALRSPHAHARIVNIDTSRAAAIAGVAVIVTAKDLVGLNPLYGVRIKDQPVLAINKVRHYGDAVAADAAEDQPIAVLCVSAIDGDYDRFTPVM